MPIHLCMKRWISWIKSERGLTWLFISFLITLLFISPILTLGWSAICSDLGQWKHLTIYVIPKAFCNTIKLLFGVGLLVSIIGTGCAWLVSAYDFPSKKILKWALLLPLSVPTYIIAFVYLDVLHPIGPIQNSIRYILQINDPRAFQFPDLRSIYGAIFVLGFVLYPYVYLSTRALFVMQSSNLLESARSLGSGGIKTFFRVVLPLVRPAISIGLVLALLETLNDIGASEFLGIQTLTISVYTTWVTRSDFGGAAQIALVMLVFTIGLTTIESHSRRKKRHFNTQMRPMKPKRLIRNSQILLVLFLGWMPVIIGFIIPALYLVSETYKRINLVGSISSQLFSCLGNTVVLSIYSTILTMLCGLSIAWSGCTPNKGQYFNFSYLCIRISSLGYAIPGTILAIGFLTTFSLVDQTMSLFGIQNTQPLTGSIVALVCTYMIRFLAISSGYIEAGFSKIQPELEQASRLLGKTSGATLFKVYLPLIRPALIASAMLVFIDSMKELPATLILRPMNFDTLSTWLYGEAVRGTYEEGAIAALFIVVVGILPISFLAKADTKME